MEDLATVDEAALEVLEEEEELDIADLEAAADEAPVVRLVNLILTDAIKRGASDIHIEPYEKTYRVRYRVDGMLYEVMNPPLKLKDAISSRIKILAKLDIAEKRLPQDGRIKMKMKYRGQAQGARLPRLDDPHAARREDRDAAPRQGEPAARHDEARASRSRA